MELIIWRDREQSDVMDFRIMLEPRNFRPTAQTLFQGFEKFYSPIIIIIIIERKDLGGVMWRQKTARTPYKR